MSDDSVVVEETSPQSVASPVTTLSPAEDPPIPPPRRKRKKKPDKQPSLENLTEEESSRPLVRSSTVSSSDLAKEFPRNAPRYALLGDHLEKVRVSWGRE